jgi:hypothetical protein
VECGVGRACAGGRGDQGRGREEEEELAMMVEPENERRDGGEERNMGQPMM